MSQATILVVDDEPSFVEALKIGLTREGFTVHTAVDGVQALEKFEAVAPDLILLDVMLPKLSGVEVCRQIRKHSSVPIVMVTARTSEIDTVVGLEVGADDYVAKPYRISELAARIRAVMRRADDRPESTTDAVGTTATSIEVGDVRLDPDEHRVTNRGIDIALALKEFEVLHLLLANAGRVLTRDTLIDRVWGHDYVGDTKTLDVHIKRLRAKLEDDPSDPKLITTIRGMGYKYTR